MVETEALALSVREDEPKEHLASSAFWWYSGATNDLLPIYGDVRRDQALRQYWYACHNTLVQGAVANLVKRIKATPWEISGGTARSRLARRFQDVLQQAEFGRGYGSLLTKMLTDYFTQDAGGFVEIIGRGDKEKPLIGPVEGLAHLDRWKCVLTGSVEHPVAYFPRRGGVIYLHRTRVRQFVDMESPDEEQFGNGLCALSRIVGTMNSQILMGRYQNEKLSNEPPAGLIVFSNVKPGSVEGVRRRYQADRERDGVNTYAPVEYIEGIDPEKPVQVEFVPFASLPDHFDEEKHTIVHVNKLALALGVDPQDIWPLTGQPLGTGTQSLILDAKGQAKTFGDVLGILEKFFNLDVLPESLEFKFKHRDRQQDRQVAETAKIWVDVATSLISSGQADAETANRLLANQIESFADVLLDEAGQVRLPSHDRVPDNQIVVDDNTDATTPDQEDQITAGDDTNAPPATTEQTRSIDLGWTWYVESEKAFTKDYQQTQEEFIRNLTDLFTGANEGELSRRRAGIVLRAQIARLGRQAFKDGLADGGVEVDELDEDDQRTVANWLAEQSKFVTNALDSIYRRGAVIDPEQRALLWTRKSLQTIYLAGVASADKNGLYEFAGPDGQESCSTCRALKGQVHRMKDWVKKRFRPQVDTENFECGGWRCEHFLRKTTGRAHGRWPVSKAAEELPRVA